MASPEPPPHDAVPVLRLGRRRFGTRRSKRWGIKCHVCGWLEADDRDDAHRMAAEHNAQPKRGHV